ncbi:MAG: sugar phosphate nucleotidyltransferase [Phycisphaerae bacterium]
MKVILFCGGRGLRLRDYSDAIPKPMVPVGPRPVLWHLMKYYAHYGHKEFILCLGHKADVIKDYFLNYDETTSNDFVLEPTNGEGRRHSDGFGRREVRMLGADTQDWRITFVDTGLNETIGERLLKVRHHLGDDERFLANYADNVTDAPLPEIIEHHEETNAAATFLSVRPSQSFHVVHTSEDGSAVTGLHSARACDIWVNGGFFVLNREVLDVLNPGEELVVEGFDRLAERRKLQTVRYDGFWAAMDTFKEKQQLDELHAAGSAPWEVWAEAKARPAGAIRRQVKRVNGARPRLSKVRL